MTSSRRVREILEYGVSNLSNTQDNMQTRMNTRRARKCKLRCWKKIHGEISQQSPLLVEKPKITRFVREE